MKRPYVRCFTFNEFKEIEKCKNIACCSYWSRFEALESEKNHERNKWTRSQNYYHQCYDDVECVIILAILCCSTFKSDDRMKVMKSHCFVNIAAPFSQHIHIRIHLHCHRTAVAVVFAFHVIHYLHNLHFVRSLVRSPISQSLISSWFCEPLCSSLRSLVIFQPNYKFFAIKFSSSFVGTFCVVFCSLFLRCMEMNANQQLKLDWQSSEHNAKMMHAAAGIALSVSQKWFIMS